MRVGEVIFLLAAEALVRASGRLHFGHDLQHLGHQRLPHDTHQDLGHIREDGSFEHPPTLGSEFLQKEGRQRPSTATEGGQRPSTKTTHKSWFERMGQAITSVFVGLFVIIPFSIALLWVNERRNAQLESLLSLAKSEAVTIETTQVDLADYDGVLVHLNSDVAKGLDAVQDARFPDVKMESGCMRLRTEVEVYQWEETEHKETRKDNVGGGETTVTSYTYSQKWCSRAIDSSSFHEDGYNNSVHVVGLEAGIQEAVNETVKYGEPYWLPEEMVQQLDDWQSAGELVGDTLNFGSSKLGSYEFKPSERALVSGRSEDCGNEGWYYCPEHRSPQIGDVRVKIQYVLDGAASILGLQMKDKDHKGGHTFGRYRSVPNGCCAGVDDEEMKKRRVRAAMMSADDLYEEDACDTGPFSCLCCCCNCVKLIFANVQLPMFSLNPQIYSAWSGEKSLKQCMSSEVSKGEMAKWGLRCLGWLLLWMGLNMVFQPTEVLLDVIPFVGPYLGSGVSWIIGVFTFFVTIAIATLIISLAYLVYHPLIGALYMAFTLGVVAAIVVIGQYLEEQSKKNL